VRRRSAARKEQVRDSTPQRRPAAAASWSAPTASPLLPQRGGRAGVGGVQVARSGVGKCEAGAGGAQVARSGFGGLDPRRGSIDLWRQLLSPLSKPESGGFAPPHQWRQVAPPRGRRRPQEGGEGPPLLQLLVVGRVGLTLDGGVGVTTATVRSRTGLGAAASAGFLGRSRGRRLPRRAELGRQHLPSSTLLHGVELAGMAVVAVPLRAGANDR
jgi:hypothetical protein